MRECVAGDLEREHHVGAGHVLAVLHAIEEAQGGADRRLEVVAVVVWWSRTAARAKVPGA
jgi:hypothetical protein